MTSRSRDQRKTGNPGTWQYRAKQRGREECTDGRETTGLQMGQGLWRVARNQQFQQGFVEQTYLSTDNDRRIIVNDSNMSPQRHMQGGMDICQLLKARKAKDPQEFINLEMLPPELSLTILSYLNATDLCLASCVWQDLANDDLLWQGLCRSTWGHCSIYNKRHPPGFSYRELYMRLDEGSLTFNANPHWVSIHKMY
ncbi:hypothetical protein GDO86_000445 [Hymenochirus boettgeri]|uniref:F-box domain-containing protein n=1 Tax=Hymenochirus boettgeri TaxID=247094 RepID=A0A8T2KGU2_9PIPI|nr:hypothetical protein GDO86_000445 [Hymenochirus boettgeri]